MYVILRHDDAARILSKMSPHLAGYHPQQKELAEASKVAYEATLKHNNRGRGEMITTEIIDPAPGTLGEGTQYATPRLFALQT